MYITTKGLICRKNLYFFNNLVMSVERSGDRSSMGFERSGDRSFMGMVREICGKFGKIFVSSEILVNFVKIW